MTSYRHPGTVLTDHTFLVPLDHGNPEGEQIEVFAREVVATDRLTGELPWLVFLQGGPGFGAPRPVGRDAWLDRALRDYRVLLLDQRGTGRSTAATRQTLARRGSPQAQAAYLAHFRADSIVLDAELIRRELTGGAPWSVLGQSFGGFCTVSYLSFAPHGIREAFLTGGLPAYIDTGLNVVHIRDVALGHLLACEKGKVGERYILGSENLTLSQILEELARITGMRAPTVKLPYFAAYTAGMITTAWAHVTGVPPRVPLEAVRMAKTKMWVSHEKASRELGYSPSPAECALKDAVAWFENRRAKRAA